MMYSEFVEGTGCKDSEKNYQIYKELEILYMNSDCTKKHIYDMGKKLVDNSKTEEQIKLEARMQAEIKKCQDNIEYYKNKIKEIKWILA